MTEIEYIKQFYKELTPAIAGFEAIKRMNELDMSFFPLEQFSVDDKLDFGHLNETILKNLREKQKQFEIALKEHGIDP